MPYESHYAKESSVEHRAHCLSLDQRKKLSISGVTEVLRFDEREILLDTVCGSLMIHGENLNISKLSVETGEVSVSGQIEVLRYGAENERTGLWAKLFR